MFFPLIETEIATRLEQTRVAKPLILWNRVQWRIQAEHVEAFEKRDMIKRDVTMKIRRTAVTAVTEEHFFLVIFLLANFTGLLSRSQKVSRFIPPRYPPPELILRPRLAVT